MRGAVVTGAASGIGLALSKQLIADGYKVLMSDIHAGPLKAEAEALGPNASTFVGDIAQPHEVANLAQKALLGLDQIDLVFANAGVGGATPLVDAPPEQFDLIFGVNVKGAWLTAQVFIKHWLQTGQRGRVCITGSEHSLGFQHTGAGLYTGSKHAIFGIADVLNRETPDTITVSVLCPGLVATGINNQSHIDGTPKQSAAEVAFGNEVMARGMPPQEVAEKAIAGTLCGDFMIVTHAVSKDGADDRIAIIERAFAAQAPPDDGTEKYRVDHVVDQVRAALASRQE